MMNNEYEILQDQLERKLNKTDNKRKSKLWCLKINHTYDPWRIIRKFLKVYTNKPYNDFWKDISKRLKPQDLHRVDSYIYRKNVNGDYVNSYGRIVHILSPVRTNGFTSGLEYYIEDDILKCNKPYNKFKKIRQRRFIKKKEEKLDPLFRFDYDVVFTFGTQSIHTSTDEEGKPRHTLFTVKQFKEWCERRKRTYKILEKGFKFGRENGKLKIIDLPEKIHIKTHYE